MPFKKWQKHAIYAPPAELAPTFAHFILYWVEHLAISAADATRRGVNVNAFNAAAWEHRITVRELNALVKVVLDTLSPLNDDGVRIPVR